MAKDYSKEYFWDDFWYGFNPINWFNGDFVGNQPSKKAEARDKEKNDLVNFNAGFEELFNKGGSSEDLMKYILDNPDVNYDPSLLSSMINSRVASEDRARQEEYDKRNLYAENLAKMKEAGINPLVGLGNVGSLGSTDQLGSTGSDVNLDSSIAKAQVGSAGYNGDLANIKNILLILLALGKLAK